MTSILYIEDDSVDQMNLLRELKNQPFQVDVVDSIDEALSRILTNKYDLIISDQYVGPNNITEELKHFEGQKFIILSNNIGSLESLNIPCFEKPFKKEMLTEVFGSEHISLTSLERLCQDDEDALIEMTNLIQRDLEDTISLLGPSFSSEDYESQGNLIHKVLSKIGILGMNQSHKKLLGFELRVRKNDALSDAEKTEVFQILNKALSFIKER